jgi:type VI secretion system protein ImpF
MAELSLRERLQPSLLDRLVDEERLLTCFDLRISRAEIVRLQLGEVELAQILSAHGLHPLERSESPGVGAESEELHWTATVPSSRVSLAQLKSLTIRPPGAPQGAVLSSFCRLEGRNVLNESVERADRFMLSSRQLREYVCRDLAALLNALSLGSADDLAPYPQVEGSVLNYGMPSLAGVAATSLDPQKTAASIELAIKRFEPRLRKVRVAPEPPGSHGEGSALSFRIDAELWGQPSAQALTVRTRIDTDSGHVSVSDGGSH